MPGTPINSTNNELNKLQNEEPKDVHQDEQNINEPVREMTQTDVLNKRLLVSFLERINKSKDLEEKQIENTDQGDSEF